MGTTRTRSKVSSPWALGDYHRFAKATIWPLGEVLVEACSIGPGQRVLDVAAGTGNVAIRAAERGAEVVAADLTPENFPAGRAEAAAHGVEVRWQEADAEALPFPDASFDAVLSCFGVIFAPHHHVAARELLRVCRPGGRLGLVVFAPEGLISDFFAACAPYLPPAPDGAQPPPLWGDDRHLQELLGGGVDRMNVTSGEYVESAADPRAYVDLFRDTFGPVTAAYAALQDSPERLSALDRDLLDFATRCNVAPPGEPARYPYSYRLVVARRTP